MSKQGYQRMDSSGRRRLDSTGKRARAVCTAACPHCCGFTPRAIQVDVDFTGFKDYWNNNARCKTSLLDPIHAGTSDIVEIECIDVKQAGLSVVELPFLGGTELGCTWGLVLPTSPVRFRYRTFYQSTNAWSDWQELPGALEIVISIEGLNGKKVTTALARFLSDRMPCSNNVLFYSRIIDCPFNCFTQRQFTNERVCAAPELASNSSVECNTVGSTVAPGTLFITPVRTGEERPDCSHDCDGAPGGDCLTLEELRATCPRGGETPYLFGTTNTHTSPFDIPSPLVEPTGEIPPGLDYLDPNGGLLSELQYELWCENRRWHVTYRTPGAESERCEVAAVFDALENGCPPAPMHITADNADVWQMGTNCDGVTYVDFELVYAA